MTPSRARAGLLAACLAWVAAVAACAQTAGSGWTALRSGTTSLDAPLAGLAAAAGLAGLGWLAVATCTTAIAVLLPAGGVRRAATRDRAARLADHLAPRLLQRTITLALSAALMSGAGPLPAAIAAPRPPAATALTAAGPPAHVIAPPAPGAGAAIRSTGQVADLAPGWGARNSATPHLDPAWGGPTRQRAAVHPSAAVVVRRGDTLWDIAARHLGPGATDAEIAETWPRWFATNRQVIGPDPDVLLPGQRLTPPGPA